MINHNDAAIQPWGFWAGLPTGLLIGSLAGAVSMLFLAPQSGKRTRARIRRQAAEWREQASDTMDDALASARSTANQITKDMSDKAESLKLGG